MKMGILQAMLRALQELTELRYVKNDCWWYDSSDRNVDTTHQEISVSTPDAKCCKYIHILLSAHGN